MPPVAEVLLTLMQREMILSLVEYPPGKGCLISRPSPDVEQVFRSCEAAGWTQEFSLGPLRVWKVTREGRAIIRRNMPTPYLHLVAEC